MLFATGLCDPESPVLLPNEEWLVAEMGPSRGCVSRLSPSGERMDTVVVTGRPNGLALGANMTVWVAESWRRAILRVDQQGRAEASGTTCDGQQLVWPNDLCFGPDGKLYFTDSGVPVGMLAEEGEVALESLSNKKAVVERQVNGRLYRLDPDSLRLECLEDRLRFPNGIAFGPDGALYVGETLTGDILRYTLDDGFNVIGRSVYGNVFREPPGREWAGPDGMAFDEEGRLYVAVVGQGDVTVLGRDGRVVDRYSTLGSAPTNVAFGPRGSGRIVVTEDEHGQIEVFDVPADGAALHCPRG